jgi:large subunit ribosomal protein L30
VAKLRITWRKSNIGYIKKRRLTLRALGFHHLNETIEQEDSPSIRGMIAKVSYLVNVEEIGHGSK